jgi:hypothetical protein
MRSPTAACHSGRDGAAQGLGPANLWTIGKDRF